MGVKKKELSQTDTTNTILDLSQKYPLPGPSLGDPAPSLVRAAISRTRRAARGSFSFPLSARAVGLRLRIRYRLFRRHQAPSSWKF